LKKGNIYPVLKRVLNKNVKIIIFSKPRISVQGIYHTRYFLQKGKLVLRSLLSEDRYFRGNRYFRDLLTPVIFYDA